MNCPKCKQQTVGLTDHFPLEISEGLNTGRAEIDTQIYASWKCFNPQCDARGNVVGQIQWETPTTS